VPTRRTLLAAAITVLVIAAVPGVRLLSHRGAPRPGPVLDERRARDLTDGYRRDAVARMPAGLRYAEAVHTFVACPGAPGRYTMSSRFDLMPDSGSAAAAFTTLRGYWRQRGYRVIEDTSGQTPQLLVENPADGFRVGISQRAARYVRLAISSPCLAPTTPPVPPVLPEDLAEARDTYERYVDGQLAHLTDDVAALRAAVGGGDPTRARAAWLVAQLCWERVGAAYGSFGDLGDAIDGDPAFTGLHRIEYGLWHGERAATVLPAVDQLAGDVTRLRATLGEVAPGPADLPLRVHEILEDALRDHLTGLTDFGGGAGLAETLAGVDATAALLDAFAPLLDARRPDLLPAVRAGLDTVRHALLAAGDATTWPPPAAVPAPLRRRIDAALGGVLESLAEAPGLLEATGS